MRFLIVVAIPLGSENDLVSLKGSVSTLVFGSIQHRTCRYLAPARIRIQEEHLPFVEPLNYHVPVVGTFVLAVIESLLNRAR